jgi:hypothetical protein
MCHVRRSTHGEVDVDVLHSKELFETRPSSLFAMPLMLNPPKGAGGPAMGARR